jgi:hypothetical protein
MRHLRFTLRASALVGLTALTAGQAQASPSFPETVANTLGTNELPRCTVCHSSPSGGFGTATTRFAEYLQSRGLRAGSTDSLGQALAAAEAERHDSDGDGQADVEALAAGEDPNGTVDVPPLEPGCQATLAPSRPPHGCWVALLAAGALGSTLRRRVTRLRRWRRPA